MNCKGLQKTYAGENLYKNQNVDFARAKLNDLMYSAANRLGQHTFVGEALQVMEIACQDFIYEIENNFDFYSIEEIEYLMYLGSRGELGDNFSISTKTVCGWLSTYKNDYRIKLTKFCSGRSDQKQLTQSTEPEKTSMTMAEIKSYFEYAKKDFLENGTIYARTYEIIFMLGNVPDWKESVEIDKQTAKKRILERADNRRSSGNLGKHEFNAILTSISNGDSDELENELKVMILERIFKQ